MTLEQSTFYINEHAWLEADPEEKDDKAYTNVNGERVYFKSPEFKRKLKSIETNGYREIVQWEHKPRMFETFTAEELLKKTFPETFFVVNDMLPAGSAILAAPAKTGKSWMMLQLAIAAASGGYFMGRKVNKCHVLYLALEDSQPRLEKRLVKSLAGQPLPGGLNFSVEAPGIGHGFIEAVTAHLEADPELKLIIVDTLQKVKPPSNPKLSAYEQDYQIFGAISSLAHDKDFCFLFLHHLRKSNGFRGGDPFENILGSTALQGSTDTMMVMERENRIDNEATLHITGRDIEPQDIILQFKNYRWESLGDADSIEQMRAENAYNSHPAIITLKKRLTEIEADENEPVKEYIVRAKDFREDVIKETGELVGTSERNFMEEVRKFSLFLLRDGIECIEPGKGKTTTYKGKQGRFHRYRYYKSK